MRKLSATSDLTSKATPQIAPRPVLLATSTPKVLLLATLPWVFPARLAARLSEAGFLVEAACPPGHILGKLSMPIVIHRIGAGG